MSNNNRLQRRLWYVEFRAYGKMKHMGGIVARDGKEAIEYVKAHVIGATCFKVWHDDDDENDGGKKISE